MRHRGPSDEAQRDQPRPDRDLADFLLRACHDLRGPMRTIRTHAELVSRSTVPAGIGQSLGFILDGAGTIESLTEGLAGYAAALRIEPSAFQPVPMDIILRNAASRLAAEIRERGASLDCGELPSVSGDAGLLRQVFEQLLRNALRHASGDSLQLHVAAQRNGDEWIFAVEDNGSGIDGEYLERIFRPFERLDASKRSAGLGLAICRVIVERHGGRIWAESTPGKGAAFRFTLPAGG